MSETVTVSETVYEQTSVIGAVRKIADGIRGRVEEIEAARRLPADLHEQLRDVGVYRLLLPASHGGLEASGEDVLEVIETLARADGSVAWTSTIGIQSPAVLSLLPRDTFEELYASGPDVTVGGAFGPTGKAQLTDGGYRVSGRWSFASGCDNWDYLFANCVVVADGEPVPSATDGQPQLRAMLVRRDQVEIIDTWYTLGLRGTGSKDFTLDDVFVPASHTFDIYSARPCIEGIFQYPVVEFAHHLASISIGVAQGALDDLIQSAAERQRVFARATVAKTPAVQHRIGKAETSLRAARDLTRSQAQQLLSGEAGDDLQDLLSWTSTNNAWTADICVSVVDACFRANGSRGVYDGSPLQRRLRDIYTVVQHATVNDGAWTRWGASLFGQEIGQLL